jgi:hypothetical protein
VLRILGFPRWFSPWPFGHPGGGVQLQADPQRGKAKQLRIAYLAS